MITLTLLDGEEIYINPEQVVFIRKPIPGEYDTRAEAVIGVGITLAVKDSPQAIRALIEGRHAKLQDPWNDLTQSGVKNDPPSQA